MNKVNIEPTWNAVLADEFNKKYFSELRNKVRLEYRAKTIYPHPTKIFNAFNLTPFDQIKVVIIGQDPYHGENQAHGLCFSVRNGIKVPPSLNNIFKELKSDLNIDPPNSGNLSLWAKQGVLMLNSVLTVRKGIANSHKNL